MEEAKLCSLKAHLVNFSLRICSQGTDSSGQLLQCLSRQYRVTSHKATSFMGTPTPHDRAKQGYKGPAISIQPRTTPMAGAHSRAFSWVGPAHVGPPSQVGFPPGQSRWPSCLSRALTANILHPDLHLIFSFWGAQPKAQGS